MSSSSSAVPSPPSSPLPLDSYEAYHAGFVHIHHALIGSFHAIDVATSLEVKVSQALAAGGFLLGHHDVESSILFPGLRRLGKLRSTDAAFLDDCDRAHHELHALCERLIASAKAPHPVAEEIAKLSRETVTLLQAHTHEEELGLMPERLKSMISLPGLLEIGREMQQRVGR